MGLETSDTNLGEADLLAPTGIDLVALSDTGSYDDDNLTNLNNADSSATLQFLVSGVTAGAEVHIYCDGVEIGTGTASDSTVTITTDGQTTITDGQHAFTATQEISGVQSDASDSLTLTIDTNPPAPVQTTAPDIAQILTEYVFDADSPDEGNDGIFYLLDGAPDGMTIDAATGEISWTPTAEQDEPQTFDIIVYDAAGNQSIQTVDMTVLGVIPAYPDAYIVDEDTSLTVGVNAGLLVNDDPDNNFGTLEASLVAGPAHGTVSVNADGSFTYTPDADFFGTDSFTYEATDNTDTSNTVKVTIEVAGVQDAPVATADSYTLNEDTTLTVNAAAGVLANDTDADGDELTAILYTQPSHGSISFDNDGSFVYTPDANYYGTDSFTYVLTDVTDSTEPITVELIVNGVDDAPTGEDDTYTMDEDDDLSVDAAEGVLENDSDPDSDTLTVTLADSPTHGTVSLDSDGSFTYSPDADFAGTDTFTYTIYDGTTVSEEVTVTITVTAVNDAPVAENDEFDVENDGTAHELDVLDNDDDPDESDSFAIVSVTQGNHNGVISIINGDEILYMPASGFTGTETFTYTIQDEDGNEATGTVTMTVAEDSTGGTDTGNGSLSGYVYVDVDNDGQFDSGELGLPGVLVTLTGTSDAGNAITEKRLTDSDGHYSFDDLPAGTYKLTESRPEIMIDGKDSTTVTDATLGNDTISNIDLDDDETFANNNFGERRIQTGYVTVRMYFASTSLPEYLRTLVGYGEECTGNSDLADAILDGVTIYETNSGGSSNTNTAPEGENDSYTVTEDETLSVNAASGVLDNDDDDDDDALVASLISGTTNGTLTLDSDGSFEYTPDADFHGTDTFTYVVYDGTTISGTATVTITVTAVNDAPVTTADAYSVDENNTLAINAADGVLDNDTDADNSSLSATLVTGPTNGTLNLDSDGSFVYTPDVNFVGTDSFTYYATDGSLNGSTVTVIITVNEGEDVPVAAADAYTVDEDTTLTIDAATGVLANDTDADGDTLKAVLDTGPSHGTLTLNADGSFEYTPDENFHGTDTFTYHANDDLFDSSLTTVTITVDSINDAPEAVADGYSVDEDGELALSTEGLLANDTDIDGDDLDVVLAGDPENGTITWTDQENGLFKYTPNPDFHGTDSFTYYVTDGNLNSDPITVTITVNSVNDLPVATDDEVTLNVNEIEATDINVLGNDTDQDTEDTLTIDTFDATSEEGATITLNSDGTLHYDPTTSTTITEGTVTSDTFTYTITDGHTGVAVTATVTIIFDDIA
jgi:VCBS repeat-containing protein